MALTKMDHKLRRDVLLATALCAKDPYPHDLRDEILALQDHVSALDGRAASQALDRLASLFGELDAWVHGR